MVSLFKTTFTFLFILSTAQEIYSQKTSDISSKQTELKEIKNEIFTLEEEIQNKSKKEKETFTILQNYDKQSFLLNKVIVGYRKEEKEKENQIAETEQKINSLEKEISANYFI